MTKKVMITADMIQGACEGQRKIFAKQWPDGCSVTKANAIKAGKLGLDPSWVAEKFLSDEVWDEHYAKCKPLRDEYHAKRKPFWDEYCAKCVLISDDYCANQMQLSDEYHAKRKPILAEYGAKRWMVLYPLLRKAILAGE